MSKTVGNSKSTLCKISVRSSAPHKFREQYDFQTPTAVEEGGEGEQAKVMEPMAFYQQLPMKFRRSNEMKGEQKAAFKKEAVEAKKRNRFSSFI